MTPLSRLLGAFRVSNVRTWAGIMAWPHLIPRADAPRRNRDRCWLLRAPPMISAANLALRDWRSFRRQALRAPGWLETDRRAILGRLFQVATARQSRERRLEDSPSGGEQIPFPRGKSLGRFRWDPADPGTAVPGTFPSNTIGKGPEQGLTLLVLCY